MTEARGQPRAADSALLRDDLQPPPAPTPLLAPAAGFLAGIVAAHGLHGAERVALWAIGGALIGLIALGLTRTRASRPAFNAGVAVVAALIGFARYGAAIRLPEHHVARFLAVEPVLARLHGTISTAPTIAPSARRNPFLPFDPPPRTSFVLSASRFESTDPPMPTRGYVRVSVDGALPQLALGDEVTLTGRLYRPRGPRNPGEADWAAINRVQGIFAGLSVDGPQYVQRTDAPRGMTAMIGRLRAAARALLFDSLAKSADEPGERLLSALILGQRSSVDRKMDEAFVRTGTVHILSVSGFHVAALAFVTWFACRRILLRGRRTAAAVTTLAIALYSITAEPNAPILRSAIMGVLAMTATLLNRATASVNWLSLSAICILLVNPLEILRPGFQLSFIQVLALLLVVAPTAGYWFRRPPVDSPIQPLRPARERWLRPWLARIALGASLVTSVAWIVSIPLVMLHFQVVTPWAALQSLLLTPLFSMAIVWGFVTVLLSAVLPPLGALSADWLSWFATGLLRLVDWVGQVMPGSLLQVVAPPTTLVWGSYAALAALWAVWRWSAKRDRPPAVAIRVRSSVACGVILLIAWSAWAVFPPARDDAYRLYVLAVGGGSAAVLVAPNGEAAVIDAGTNANFDAGETVVHAARALGVRRIALVAVSHANFDHYSGVPTLLAGALGTQAPSPPRLVVGPLFRASDERGTDRLFARLPAETRAESLSAGDTLQLGAATIEVLWPRSDLPATTAANDSSLVLRVRVAGRDILLPGDIEQDGIRGLIEERDAGRANLRCDVLVAPHHGSVIPRDSPALFEAVAPRDVIASTGRARPALAELAANLPDGGPRVWTTLEHGAICVRIGKGGELSVAAWNTPP
ncbi:MAG: ComEC/Rec2 family competence protein [Phycisphaerae bacterium]